MDRISFSHNLEYQKNTTEVARAFSDVEKLYNEDPEFQNVPKPSEEEAAREIEERIKELRTFIQSQ